MGPYACHTSGRNCAIPRWPAGPSRFGSNPENAISCAATAGASHRRADGPRPDDQVDVRGRDPLGVRRRSGGPGTTGAAERGALPVVRGVAADLVDVSDSVGGHTLGLAVTDSSPLWKAATDSRHGSPEIVGHRSLPAESHIWWASATMFAALSERSASGQGFQSFQSWVSRPAMPVPPDAVSVALEVSSDSAMSWPASRAGREHRAGAGGGHDGRHLFVGDRLADHLSSRAEATPQPIAATAVKTTARPAAAAATTRRGARPNQCRMVRGSVVTGHPFRCGCITVVTDRLPDMFTARRGSINFVSPVIEPAGGPDRRRGCLRWCGASMRPAAEHADRWRWVLC